jgi:hypothetical protein
LHQPNNPLHQAMIIPPTNPIAALTTNIFVGAARGAGVAGFATLPLGVFPAPMKGFSGSLGMAIASST